MGGIRSTGLEVFRVAENTKGGIPNTSLEVFREYLGGYSENTGVGILRIPRVVFFAPVLKYSECRFESILVYPTP